MKTQQELQLYYWGPHFDMVKEYNAKHGCDVQPWECVKLGNDTVDSHPCFDFPIVEKYTFALAILYDDKRNEHRPVWEGSELYSKKTGTKGTVLCADSNVMGWIHIEWEEYQNLTTPISNWSWNPPTPKRTFKLNDMELPCPINSEDGTCLVIGNKVFYFETLEQRTLVCHALVELLTAARDKE